MRAGRLRHRIAIEQKVQTQDPDSGEMLWTWSAFASDVPAEISPLSAKEFTAAQETQAQVSARILLRYLPGLTANMRIREPATGAVYNISGALPDPKSGLQWITLPVSTGVNDG